MLFCNEPGFISIKTLFSRFCFMFKNNQPEIEGHQPAFKE